jgi:DNA mismatch endonuclease (patch repair protein)
LREKGVRHLFHQKHFRPPKTNTEWWLEKVQDNQERDTKKTMLIKKHGWMVLRYWEHEIQRDNAIKIAMKISMAVKKRFNAQA